MNGGYMPLPNSQDAEEKGSGPEYGEQEDDKHPGHYEVKLGQVLVDQDDQHEIDEHADGDIGEGSNGVPVRVEQVRESQQEGARAGNRHIDHPPALDPGRQPDNAPQQGGIAQGRRPGEKVKGDALGQGRLPRPDKRERRGQRQTGKGQDCFARYKTLLCQGAAGEIGQGGADEQQAELLDPRPVCMCREEPMEKVAQFINEQGQAQHRIRKQCRGPLLFQQD